MNTDPDDGLQTGKRELAVQILRSSGQLRLRAWGSSMLPTIWPGDVLQIENVGCEALTSGDLLLVGDAGCFRIHRLVRKISAGDGFWWITRGDAMPQQDPPAPSRDILGRVSAIYRYGRAVARSPKFSMQVRGAGFVLSHCDSIRNLALRLHAYRENRSLQTQTIAQSANLQSSSNI